MKQTNSSASISTIRSDIILSIPTGSLVPFLLLNPNWSSPSTSSIFLSILLPSTFSIIFAVCAIRLIVRWFPHFVTCGFFFTAINVNSVKSLGHSPVYIRCWSISSLFPNHLLPIIWVHLQQHHHLLQPTFSSFPWRNFPLHYAKYMGLYRLYLLPLQVRLLGFPVD